MSYAPRPYSRPFSSRASKGASIVSTPTVSMCAFSKSAATAARPARRRDHVRASGSGVLELDLEPCPLAPLGHVAGDLGFAGRARDQIAD